MKTLGIAFLAALAASIAACGGGTGGTGVTSGSGGTNAVSIGVMQTTNSVAVSTVNGVNFAVGNAQITIDGTSATPAALQSGMVAKILGQINDDGVTGTAQVVQVETEVRGTVQTHDSGAVPPVFTVVGQTVFVDDLTVFANFSSVTPTPSDAVAALQNGTSVVEVHGLRDASGNIFASRVELLAGPNALGDELRGTVAAAPAPTLTAFTLQNGTTTISVDFTGAMISPTGATVTANEIVEIHGSFNGMTFSATLVNVEDNAQFQHVAGEEYSIEGQVSGCAGVSPCASFSVGKQAVQTGLSTQFVNGTAADLADNITVEAEGHQFNGNALVAEKIEFQRPRVVLTGQVTAVTGTIVAGTGNTGSVTVLGNAVQITTLTDVRTNNAITTADRVEVRGFLDSTGAVVAEQIDDNPSGNPNRDTVQAVVTAVNGNVLTVLGINADVTHAAFEGVGTNTLTAFLAAITPGSTLVKLSGAFTASPNTMAVDEAELED